MYTNIEYCLETLALSLSIQLEISEQMMWHQLLEIALVNEFHIFLMGYHKLYGVAKIGVLFSFQEAICSLKTPVCAYSCGQLPIWFEYGAVNLRWQYVLFAA